MRVGAASHTVVARRIHPHVSRPARQRKPIMATAEAAPESTVTTIQLHATPLTPESFESFGQVIGWTDDGKEYDGEDAQLRLDQGTPRFYIMRLAKRGHAFSRITFHAKVTQCLGCLGDQPWYMAVARPSGGVAAYPQPADLAAFRVPPGCFIKLHMGTWHAGPLFDSPSHMDFYNLELKDTNVVDHNTHDYSAQGLRFQIVDES